MVTLKPKDSYIKPLRQISAVCLYTLSLSACIGDGTSNDLYFWDSAPSDYSAQMYPENYDSSFDDYRAQHEPSRVVVPQSYHLGIANTPTASKDEDKQWIDGQNPESYTIQIARDTKPASVANKLQKTPKNERSAEVKSQSGTYIGVYGTYPTREAAEAKLNSLPAEIKDQAQIKNWHSVQNDVK